MSTVDTLAEKLGVPAEKVAEILASAGDPTHPASFTGYARCMTGGCESYDSDRPVDMVREFTEQRSEDLGIPISTSEHFHPVEDADMFCPDCGQPCALLPEKRRTIPKMI